MSRQDGSSSLTCCVSKLKPGHTRRACAGDTLFSLGCGRLFEVRKVLPLKKGWMDPRWTFWHVLQRVIH
eukprot:1152321-Pelagomonas_calceolata.AAC.6